MARTVKKTAPKKRKEVPRRMLYPNSEAAFLLCCSPGFLREEMDAGRLKYIIRNSRRLVPAFAIDDYLHDMCVGGKSDEE